MTKYSYFYLAKWSEGRSRGVTNKIINIVSALEECGYTVDCQIVRRSGIKAEMSFLNYLLYPFLYLQFSWRIPAYKKYFNNLQT